MKALEEVIHLVSDRIVVFKTMASIIKLEARLAGLSVFPMLLTLCLLIMVFIGLWLWIQITIAYLIQMALQNTLMTLELVLLLNLVSLSILIKLLVSNLKKMSFEKTRAYFLSREAK